MMWISSLGAASKISSMHR